MTKYSHLLLSFFLSILFFYPFNVKYIIYVIITTLIWTLLLGKYKLKKNCCLYQELASISIGNLLALMLDKWLVHGTLHMDCLNMVLCAAYACFLVYVWYKCDIMMKTNRSNAVDIKSEKKLFPKRQYDLERIIEYIGRN